MLLFGLGILQVSSIVNSSRFVREYKFLKKFSVVKKLTSQETNFSFLRFLSLESPSQFLIFWKPCNSSSSTKLIFSNSLRFSEFLKSILSIEIFLDFLFICSFKKTRGMAIPAFVKGQPRVFVFKIHWADCPLKNCGWIVL